MLGHSLTKIGKIVICVGILGACSLPIFPQPDSEIVNSIEGMPTGEVPLLDPELQLDPCLFGTWIMYQPFLEELVQAMVPVPGMHVPDGELVIAFDGDGVWQYEGFFTLRMDMAPDQYLEALSQFDTGGTYGTNNEDVIVFDLTVAEMEALSWTGYKGGEAFTVSGGGPSFTMLPPGTAPYRCSDLTLEIDTINPAEELVTMLFVKE